MKAIYTKIGENVYRINQPTGVPSDVTFKAPGSSSTLNIDPINGNVSQNITINTLKKPGTKSNAQLYKDLVAFIKEKEITEISSIQNFFKVYIDYTVFEDGREIEHAQVIRPTACIDKALILGVATNNECVYRRVKDFNPKIEFRLKHKFPHGIMQQKKSKYILKINNIAIFESKREFQEVHNSTYNVAYDVPSSIINASVDGDILVYSSYNDGIDIQGVELNFIPREVSIFLDIILTKYVVVYDDKTITDILIENIDKKYSEDTQPTDPEAPSDGSEDDILIPDDDPKKPADGDYEPDENGYYDWYERCKLTTPNALLVVEDLISDASYNVNTMIKKSMVVQDIPDIEVGEYVLYRESLDQGNDGQAIPSENGGSGSEGNTSNDTLIVGDGDVDDEI